MTVAKNDSVGLSNPSVFAKHPASPPPAHVPDHRADVVKWANWCIAHKALFDYSEGANRMSMIHMTPGQTSQRITADCSASCTGIYKWAGADDPNGSGYNGQGFTGTLLEHMHHVTIAQAKPGDLIVYGPGTGTHVQLILERIYPTDFWTFSHGHQGAPDRVRHSDSATWMSQHGHPGVTFLSSLQ